MSKIYIADYGIEGCVNGRPGIEEIIKKSGWKRTGFDTTLWQDVEGVCDIENARDKLENTIKNCIADKICKISILIVCVDKCEVIGTKNGKVIFGSIFNTGV